MFTNIGTNRPHSFIHAIRIRIEKTFSSLFLQQKKSLSANTSLSLKANRSAAMKLKDKRFYAGHALFDAWKPVGG